MNQAVRLVSGATKALKAKNLSVWIGNERTQQRGVKQYYVTEAAGYLVVAVVVIKDSKIPELTMKLWSTDGGYELWTVFLPNSKRAAARGEVISSAAIASTARRDIVPQARREVANQQHDNAFDDLDLVDDDDDEEVEGGPNEGASLGVLMMEKLFIDVFIPAMVKHKDCVATVNSQQFADRNAMEINRIPTPPISTPRSQEGNSPRTRNIRARATSSSSSSSASSSSSSTASPDMMESNRIPTPPIITPRNQLEDSDIPRTSNILPRATSSSSFSSATSSSLAAGMTESNRVPTPPTSSIGPSTGIRLRAASSSSSIAMPQTIATQNLRTVASGENAESLGTEQRSGNIREEISNDIINSVARNPRAGSNVPRRDFLVAALQPILPPSMTIMHNEFGEPILFMYDGDNDQIQATWSQGLAACNHYGIEVFKIPGGGSLQWQPNDLMRAHNIIHSYCGTSRYHSRIHDFEPPCWLGTFERTLLLYGIDKASRDCFVNFMRQIPTILSQAFTVSNTRQGWKGLCPPDTRFILNKCDRFNSENFTDEERTRIVNTIDTIFIPESSLSGMITDDRITEALGDLVGDMTHKFHFHKKPTNHQRAIWWNHCGQTLSGVLAVRAAELQRREDKRAEAAAVAMRKAVKVAQAARKAEVDAAFLGGFANFTENRDFLCYCSNDCSPQVRNLSLAIDDGWRGCPVTGCAQFYCAKNACKNRLLNHVKNCMQKL